MDGRRDRENVCRGAFRPGRGWGRAGVKIARHGSAVGYIFGGSERESREGRIGRNEVRSGGAVRVTVGGKRSGEVRVGVAERLMRGELLVRGLLARGGAVGCPVAWAKSCNNGGGKQL